MKKEYVKPTMIAEQFFANEYVAACGEGGTVYNFVCDAGYVDKEHEYVPTLFGVGGLCGCGVHHQWDAVPGGTYKASADWKVTDKNGNNITQQRYTYHPCGTTHSASTTDDFITGYMDNVATDEVEHIEVIVWRGENGDNVHCTTNLDMDTWTTAKS